ncbi:MAG: KAP family NTPase [Defluviitaleaceae bacterium]|nr:KAP family NTPase [Defluviitaleaceae bacterium]
MQNFSTKPTVDSAVEMFSKDTLGRNTEIARFVNLLDAIDSSCTIALNGEWGSGKTFFVKQTKLVLDCYNEHSDIGDEHRKKVQDRNIECTKNYATVYYDAWANDNAEDPVLSLVYNILKSNRNLITKLNKGEDFSSIVDIAASIIDVCGTNVSGLIKKLKEASQPHGSTGQDESVQEKVKKIIDSLTEQGNRLVIFIDELDRCNPTYAIRLLERIKHYFDDERVIFVFSVNLEQLQHTVRGYYGAGLDATGYLDKFFDLRISLGHLDYDAYLRCRFQDRLSDTPFDITCIQSIKYFNLAIRQIERYMTLTQIVNHLQYSPCATLSDTNLRHDVMKYFAPVAIALSISDLELFREFVSGKRLDILQSVLKMPNPFSSKIPNEMKIQEIYKQVFKPDSRTSKELKSIISLLHPNCDYSFQ